jgi:hypothetical protein
LSEIFDILFLIFDIAMQSNRRRVQLSSFALRARRRKRARIIAVLVVLVVLALIAGFFYLMRAPFLRIQTVQVNGADAETEREIQQYVMGQLSGYYGFMPKNHVWEYAKLDLEDGILSAFPRLASATPKLQSLTMLTVTVSGRLPYALWCGESASVISPSCQVVDQNGVAYGVATTTNSQPFVRYYGALDTGHVPAQFLTQKDFRSLAAATEALAQILNVGPVASAAVDHSGTVTMRFQDGFVILFKLSDAAGTTDALTEHLALALKSKPFKENKLSDFEYLDLRFGDSLYYKLNYVDAPSRTAATSSAAQ